MSLTCSNSSDNKSDTSEYSDPLHALEALSESEWEEDENEKQPRPIFESLTPEPEIKSTPWFSLEHLINELELCVDFPNVFLSTR